MATAKHDGRWRWRQPGTLPSPDEVRERLDYDPETGDFWHRPKIVVDLSTRLWNGRYAGKLAGCIDPLGYRIISINNRLWMAHRLAWVHVHGEWPPDEIDHINGIRSDNRIANLRKATAAQNRRNRGASSNSKTGIRGVSRCSMTGRWIAMICADGVQKNLGRFNTIEEAKSVYMEAAHRLYGEFMKVE